MKSESRASTNTFAVVFLLLLLLSVGDSKENNDPQDYDDIQLLPSDVPVTMMDRLNRVKDAQEWDPVNLRTNQGIITGLRVPTTPPHHSNTHMYSFRGIPYAEAPVGKLRFNDPVDVVGKWPENHLNATKYKPFCPQYDTESKTVLGAEDCLYLNVYTPTLPGSTEEGSQKGKMHPVFVFLHGGGYIRGSSSAHGAEKLLSRDVVVVTLNYRLGALGFLSTGDSVLPGNYGALDQVSALRWVQRNIAQYGGDPNRVTLGGFSAGASSVHLHMVSPLSENLFHRAILMSGSGFCPWAVRRNPLEPTKLIADKLGCSTGTSSSISTCLANKTVNEIVTAQASMHRYEFSPVWFAPVVDGGLRSSPFLPLPLDQLRLRPVPSMVGSVPNEGLLFAAGVVLLSKEPGNATSTHDECSRDIFSPWPYPETDEVMRDLAEAFYYSKHSRTSRGILLEELTEVITDFSFGHSIWDAAATIAETGVPVYTYLMTHRDPGTPTWALPLYQKLKDLDFQSPLLEEGVSHGDDLVHLFSFPYTIGESSTRDKRVTQIILNTFTNFITDGLPQKDLHLYQLEDLAKWEPLAPGQPVGYYNISVNPSVVYKPYRVKEQNFWRSLIPRPASMAFPGGNETLSKSNESRHKNTMIGASSLLTQTCSSSSIEGCPH